MRRPFDEVEEVTPELLEALQMKVEEGFVVLQSTVGNRGVTFRVEPKYPHKEAFSKVLRALEASPYLPLYRRSGGELRVQIAQRKGGRRGELRPAIHLLLLLATVITTTLAGYTIWAEGDLGGSVLFALALMAILGLHELGHALMARRRGIEATLPFFIPAPPPIPFGTFGAVIFMNSPVPNRRALFDVGVSGPLAGFLVALPLLILGISLSHVASPASALEGEFLLGSSILFMVLAKLAFGDFVLLDLHPLAVAGWIGLFVTSLNLLPMGQLDGGHVVRSLMPRHYRKVYFGVATLLLVAGLYWPGWFFWAFLVYLVTRMDHPGPLDDVSELDLGRKLVALLVLLILVLSFIPTPIIPTELLPVQ